ncbi:SRPBCC domain-containing protein [bacterium]|nr:SRPBCC domain-containing protein [bacterium]
MNKGRVIQAEVTVPAKREEVWAAWTTEAGAMTFFAPECKIELEPMGAYEMYFDPESPAGQRGGEGCRIMALQPEAMLSFTWNAPPSLSDVRGQYTHVVLRLAETSAGETRLTFIHDGWGEGGQWDQAYDYFTAAWKRVVLPRLIYRFTEGPVDWDDLPDLSDWTSD